MNLRSTLELAKALLPAMQAARFGRIVTRGLPFRTSYAASKGDAREHRPNHRHRAGAPRNHGQRSSFGPTETELFWSNNPPRSEGEARYVAQVLLGRLGRPEEVAAAIAFVAAGRLHHGQTLFVDGGVSLDREA
jgi:NAD(P)-dependent dehydrogenase (short-subunit alcohol dehydrogenase family)